MRSCVFSSRVVAFILAALCFSKMTEAVDRKKFKTCSQSPFCYEHRTGASEPEAWLEASEVSFDGQVVTAPLRVNDQVLHLKLYKTTGGALRVQVDEKIPRWKPPYVLVNDGVKPVEMKEVTKSSESIRFSFDQAKQVEINFKPLKISLLQGDEVKVVVNNFGDFYYKTGDENDEEKRVEHVAKKHKSGREVIDWGEDGKPIYAPIEGKDSQDDGDNDGEAVAVHHSKQEVGVDVSFIDSKGVFGLPERTMPLNIPNTKDKEPYRLYNLDVFEFEINEPMGTYGSIPIAVSHAVGADKQTFSAGVFWNNPSDSFVDFSDEVIGFKDQLLQARKIKWMSEAGNFDLFIFPGGSLQDVMHQIKETAGPQILPPLFSLGYHQCRWNYNDQKDLLEVNQGFEKHDIPMDVLWLDIEHTNGRRYFTFDEKKFPDPIKMYEEIDFYGRKVVNIVDPHIKRDDKYYVHSEAKAGGFYIKDSSGEDFDGWCWPGSSSYLDFCSSDARQFWAELFAIDRYKGTLNSVVHIWNDMNEPSVFNHDEVTIPKDTKNYLGAEFREFHNAYGMYFQASSQAGLHLRDLKTKDAINDDLVWRNLKYSPEKLKNIDPTGPSLERGFVLSRAFFAGTQRAGAIWTGDNAAEWSHLRSSVPMCLSISIAGLSFCGADVGGFFGNPEPELLVRWYQTAIFQPFFRGHAHIETKRREPWLFGEENTKRIRDAIALRYRFLPYIYTTFANAEAIGMPVMRPLFFNFPEEADLMKIEDQWMLGDNVLAAPVMEEGVSERTVRFPSGKWYNVLTQESFDKESTMKVDLNTMLIFQRGGSIIPQKMRLRRASKHMKDDPFTLVIALDDKLFAEGDLYMDDEVTYDYNDKKAFCKVKFTFEQSVLRSAPTHGNKDFFSPQNEVERIVILGAKNIESVKTAKVVAGKTESEVEVIREGDNDVLVIRNPRVKVGEEFFVSF